MSNDISTMYTKDVKRKTGCKVLTYEKITAIKPADYGDYILQRRRRRSGGKKK